MPRRLLASLPLLCLLVPASAAADDVWGGYEDEGLHLEISHTVGLGAIVTEEPPYFAGTVELAFVGYLDNSITRDDREDSLLWGLFLGDTMGLAPRLSIIANGSQTAAPWVVAVGGGLVLLDRIGGEPVRIPTVLGTLLPEIGAIFRAYTATAFYLAWELPFSVRMDRHVAMDVAFRVYAIDDWLEERVEEPGIDPWNYVMTVNVGVRLIE